MRRTSVNVFLAASLLSSLCFGQAASQPSPLPELSWKASGELVLAPKDPTRGILSIKDPSVVRFNDRWHVYATTASARGWGMVYLSFKDWAEANDAKPFFMDQNPSLKGYHCAPQVFFFEPQKKWYLIYQSQQPQYSTADDLSDPASWTAPQDFFAAKPKLIKDLWIDYWIICDATHAYLFFTGDDGRFYRSRTALSDFPKGMSEPVVVMEDKNRFHLFEGSATYKLKGTDQYLTIIEAIGPDGARFYRGFLADRLDGDWRPVADTWEHPFAGMSNVTFADGVKPWTRDVSHGELIRDGYDQTMTVDPKNLQLLFQGMTPPTGKVDYLKLPYRLGLLHLDGSTTRPTR